VLRAGRITVQVNASITGSVSLETTTGGGPFADGSVLVAGVLNAIGAGAGGDGGEIEIEADGALTVAATGTIVARPLPGAALRGGTIELSGGAGLQILAGPAPLDAGAQEDGQAGGEISLFAGGGSALACARPLRTAGDAGGPVTIVAGGALTLGGSLDARGGTGCIFGYFGWGAGGDVVLSAGADLVVGAPIDVSGSPCFGPSGLLSATAGGSISCAQIVATGGYAPGSIALSAGGDVLVSGGLDAAGRDGFGLAGLSAPAQVLPGSTYALTAAGPPNTPLFVALGAALAPAPLGPFGFTQLSPLALLPLADPGVLGAPLPGSATDAEGAWNFAATVPPGLAGLTLYAEALFFDLGAPNGLFHQPPAVATAFR
jgi:hypothetical protein